MWFSNWTIFDRQAKVTGSASSSSLSAAKMARGSSVCRPRFGAGSASRSTVNGRLGGGPLSRNTSAWRRTDRCLPSKSALSWWRWSARVWSSRSTCTEDAGIVSCC
ncbi:unnamed protein product [Prunus armeniaca]